MANYTVNTSRYVIENCYSVPLWIHRPYNLQSMTNSHPTHLQYYMLFILNDGLFPVRICW